MSPFDSIYGWVIVASCAVWFAAFVIVAFGAWAQDRSTARRAKAMAAHPAGRLYEASAYQTRGRCMVADCGQAAAIAVGPENWLLCHDCADELGHTGAATYTVDFTEWERELKEETA